ncbi:YT521-B-like domain-containing protein [Pisolithus marmoratus]|nr:YT521-B-like domain-containing protein [Pisolithus marmoratus]
MLVSVWFLDLSTYFYESVLPSYPPPTFPLFNSAFMSSDGYPPDKSDAPSSGGMSRRGSSQQQQQHQASAGPPSVRTQNRLPQATPEDPSTKIPNLSAPLSRNTVGPSSVFSASPPPSQSYPSYSPGASFGGLFTSSQHPQHYPNPPHHPYAFSPHGYHAHAGFDGNQYQQGYLPVVHHPIQTYYQPHSVPEGVSYPPPVHTSMSPQSVPGNPRSSRTPPYGAQQYQPLHYGSPSSPFPYSQHFPLGPYQWYYMAGAPFSEGMQMQYPHSLNYPPQQQQHHRHAEVEGMSGPSSERPPPASPVQQNSTAGPQGRKPAFSQPVSIPARLPAPPAVPTRSEKGSFAPAGSLPRAQTERPSVRRPYHPNPPSNRSEWVMWLGNVPGDATHDELWRFLRRPLSPGSGKKETSEVPGNGVTSIFLISRSNCAFVNFDTEGNLQRAITKFNGQQLRPQDRRCPRLVCRARRREDDLRAGVGGQRGMGVHTEYIRKLRQEERDKAKKPPSSSTDDESSIISDGSEVSIRSKVPPAQSDEDTTKGKSSTVKARSVSSYASTNSSFLARYFPKRFFILKSLTRYDLDLSVERGLWATQRHNEVVLDQAYRTSKEVILIFGVNKSGEFYGYARMASRVLHGESNVSWASRTDASPSSIHSMPPSQSRQQLQVTGGSPGSPAASTYSREGPLNYFTPSEHRLVGESPLPISTLDWDPIGARSSTLEEQSQQERRSAPARLGPSSPFEFTPSVRKQRFNLTEGNKYVPPLWSKVPPSAAASIPAKADIVLDRSAPVKAVRNSRSVEESSLLQPVQEENLTGSDDAPESTRFPKEAATEGQDINSWGETFKVEWLCTQPLPFPKTRHLRNPWNHDREIKVSRDGTELEPGVGQRLIDEWATLAAGAEEGRVYSTPKRSGKSTVIPPMATDGPSTKGNESVPSRSEN